MCCLTRTATKISRATITNNLLQEDMQGTMYQRMNACDIMIVKDYFGYTSVFRNQPLKGRLIETVVSIFVR